MISKLAEIIEIAKSKPKKRLVVAYGQDAHTIGAICEAQKMNIVEVTLVGETDKIIALLKENHADPKNFEIIHEADEMKSGVKAVDYVLEGKADIIMKGLISTDKYMKCLLNKERGLLPVGAILSHITVVKNPRYHKLLLASDVAIIPEPDLNQKITIINYLTKLARSLGIEKPKVAVIAATEKANPKMPACIDAALLSKMAERGQIKNCFVDGPLALDVAVNKEAVEIKGIISEVAGDADCLLFPDIEAGNVFYKSMTMLSDSDIAAIVVGTKVPAILSSRGDSEETKLYSIALAAVMQ